MGNLLRKSLVVSLAMLVWGMPAFANLPPAADLSGEVEKISIWTAHLNNNYPTLHLEVVVAVDKNQTARAVLREINQLKDVLAGDRRFPARSFMTLACTRPECFVGDK